MEFAFGKLAVIPWLMKDIHGKETKLGNDTIDGAVSKTTFFLKPFDVIAKLLPRNIFWRFMKDVLKIIKITADVGRITFQGMVRKTTE